ncbi:MAG: 6-pyruvoyl-tetrahydropterin synthase-related protein [Anaerolineales bacterium]
MDSPRKSQRQTRRRYIFLALCIALGLLAAAPLWGEGIVNTRGGGDSPFLLQRTIDMAESLRHGIFPARWMAHAAYELGYPFFHHYAALPYYLSGGLTALWISPLIAIQATQTLGFVCAALAMALWAERVFHSRIATLIAVAAYTFAPFHMVNVYVRGDSLSEFWAFVWYPLILWALDRLAERPTSRRAFVAALTYGALILTHNVSALIFSPFALLYALVQVSISHRSAIQNPRKRLLILITPFVLGVLLTTWFWLPAIAETRYGQMGEAFTADYFHYSRHFRSADLIQSTLSFDYSVATTVENTGPFAMGWVQAMLALLGVVSLTIRIVLERRQTAPRLYLLFGLALATAMITPLSRPLWAHLPLLEMTQFPWRFLSVQALFTAIVTGSLGTRVSAKTGLSFKKIPHLVLCGGLCALTIAAALVGLRSDRLRIGAGDVTWEKLRLYESFTGNIGTTIRHEYLPADVVPRPYISSAVVDGMVHPIADGEVELEATLLKRTPVQQRWTVMSDGAAPIAFPLNWWPGWRARVDGSRVEAYAMPGSGRLTVDLPAGEHTVTLHLGATPLRAAANLIALLAWVASGVYLMTTSGTLAKVKQQPCKLKHFALCSGSWLSSAIGNLRQGKTETIKFALWALGLLALCLILPALWSREPAGRATFFDFHRMPYPHAGPVDFEVIQLEDLDYAPATAQPGDTIIISPTWSALTTPALTGTLRLVSLAEPRHGIEYELAQTTFELSGPEAIRLALPPDLTRGLYLIELRLFGSEGELFGRTAQGRGMGPLYVGAVRAPAGPPLTPEDTAAPLAEFRDLTLHNVAEIQPVPTELHLKMTWETPGTPRNWSLSLRLLNAEGRQLAQWDGQPGYGYLPTTLWRADELITDHLQLTLPEGLAPGDYVLRVIAYLQTAAGVIESGGEVDIPITLSNPTRREQDTSCCKWAYAQSLPICEAAHVGLINVELPDKVTEGEDVTFQATWQALARPTADVRVTWTLLAPEGEAIAREEKPLAPGSHTSEWPPQTWVKEPVHLDLPATLPAGDYSLQLQLHTELSATPLVACTLPGALTIAPRPRAFAAPDLAYEQSIAFGDKMQLLGYDLDQQADVIKLTVWWQAQQSPGRDYKRFVHLFDPATEEIVAQDDAMPRAWAYPTSLWTANEVISETISLAIAGISAGDYRLAVGWYDPETATRLPAIDSTGQPLPADRAILTPVITLKP